MKKAISRQVIAAEYPKEFLVRYDTLTAEKQMLSNILVPNKQVQEANIHELFQFYDQAFFEGKLDGKVLLEWSTKMTLCAGICYCQQFDSSGLGLFCTVRLSQKLLQYRTLNNLLETLLHELVHAYLFLTKSRYARDDGVDGHGPDFIQKMLEINETTGLKLSVYHQFQDEVDQTRDHVWLCDGKCGTQPPYYGVVKRARNMPPSKNDWWFSKHQSVCGGSYIKVIEPSDIKQTSLQIIKKPKEESKRLKFVKKLEEKIELKQASLDEFFSDIDLEEAIKMSLNQF